MLSAALTWALAFKSLVESIENIQTFGYVALRSHRAKPSFGVEFRNGLGRKLFH